MEKELVEYIAKSVTSNQLKAKDASAQESNHNKKAAFPRNLKTHVASRKGQC